MNPMQSLARLIRPFIVHRFVPPHVNAAEQIVQLRLQTVKAFTGAIVYPNGESFVKGHPTGRWSFAQPALIRKAVSVWLR